MEKLDSKKTALIVVDMQNKFCSAKGFFARAGLDVLPMTKITPNIISFAELLKKKGVLVVYTKQIENYRESPENIKNLFKRNYKDVTPHITKTNFEGKFYMIKPDKYDIVIEKKTWDAFSNPKLNRLLKSKKIKYLIIAGIYTNVCVESTARRAFTEGYEIVIPKDLVAVSNHNKALHNSSLKTMDKYIAQVVNSKDILIVNQQKKPD
ncbi:MAG: cysteine hydrolase [Candidatus Aenigmarchaeota archaeon]|nr:cysteine hydrolase [Candidatus Aenigmarchaeota archaeon]